MKNVTYLLGAGASKNALPIVTELPWRIENFIKSISADEYKLSSEKPYDKIPLGLPQTKRQIQESFIESLNWLVLESRNHASIDTFAKKLWLRNEHQLLARLKCTFSAYFILEQAIYPVDKRYDSFFASILDSLRILPQHINILSWNYDYQIEKAYADYIQEYDFSPIRNRLNIDFKQSTNWPPNHREFVGLKLNGSAIPFSLDSNSSITLNEKISIELIDTVLSSYATYLKSFDSFGNDWKDFVVNHPLSFAWENRKIRVGSFDTTTSIIDAALHISEETEVLVVIGYSFPFFNRNIDRKIIQSMSKLEKVYFQAPNADEIKETFLSVIDFNPEKLISIKNTTQFYLPSEL